LTFVIWAQFEAGLINEGNSTPVRDITCQAEHRWPAKTCLRLPGKQWNTNLTVAHYYGPKTRIYVLKSFHFLAGPLWLISASPLQHIGTSTIIYNYIQAIVFTFRLHTCLKIPWSVRLPDLSPTEHIWSIMDQDISFLPTSDDEDLTQHLDRIRHDDPQEDIHKLYQPMSRRMMACIKDQWRINTLLICSLCEAFTLESIIQFF